MNKIAGSTDSTPSETNSPSGSKPESSSEPTPLQSEGDSTPLSTHKRLARKHSSKRENVREKAERMLVFGRLRIVEVDGERIIAECRGDSGEVYKLGHDPRNKQWRCGCPALGPCSHLHALWAVTAVER